ncbi:hypothetical protein JHN53_15490 [Streptomyces sp. MBT58]|uniref:hypothetical protein n=1 Tax=Streptomyces sp. MBT58 TaxID=1488389 RepID=UPI00191438D3|nr:hypothetical protein [Streptomyces sp. MBT58]MBK5993015.1 hypothetical protein [Streptomyces sp. MBT58]
MMQVQQGVIGVLASLGRFHEELIDISRRILREHDFGSDVELIHHITIESIEQCVEFTSLHRFTVSIVPDFAGCKEIEIVASVLFAESACTAVLEIRSDEGQTVEESGERKLTLYEASVDGAELSAAIGFLGNAVRDMGNLADPLKDLAERQV